jgi:hypothetical protein
MSKYWHGRIRSDPPSSVADSLETAQNLELIPDNLVLSPLADAVIAFSPRSGASPADGLKLVPYVYLNKGIGELVPGGLREFVSIGNRWMF